MNDANRKPRETFAEIWDGYADLCLPPGCSEVQRQETKRAFYSGAFATLGFLLVTLSPDDEPTEADIERLDALHKEIQAEMECMLGGGS